MSRRAKGPRLYLRKWKGCAPTWVIRDLDVQVSTGCSQGDIAGAEKRLADYIGQKHQPQTSESSSSRILIADVVNIYLREHAPHVTNQQFIAHTAAPIIEWWGGKTLSTIRARTCRDYVMWRTSQKVLNADRHVSDQTARHDFKTLRAAVNYYHREYGPLDAVPAFTLPDKARGRDRFLSRAEAARLLWAARRTPYLARLILVGIYTGTRSAAMLGLRWTPALQSGWVDIEHGLLYRAGAAQRETAKKQPTVQIPARLLAHLKRWHRLDVAKLRGSVFSVRDVSKSWATARTATGLGPDVVVHTLRHTCVTWLLTAGVTPWRVAGFVGMSLEQLDRTYGHHAVHHPVSARNGLNENATDTAEVLRFRRK